MTRDNIKTLEIINEINHSAMVSKGNKKLLKIAKTAVLMVSR
jgi:hypothetical protein